MQMNTKQMKTIIPAIMLAATTAATSLSFSLISSAEKIYIWVGGRCQLGFDTCYLNLSTRFCVFAFCSNDFQIKIIVNKFKNEEISRIFTFCFTFGLSNYCHLGSLCYGTVAISCSTFHIKSSTFKRCPCNHRFALEFLLWNVMLAFYFDCLDSIKMSEYWIEE